MPMVHGLRRVVQAESDQEATGDGEQVNEELAEIAYGVLGRVNIQHGTPVCGNNFA